MSLKKLKSQGYDYFEDLPDELLIVIFTKLSSADGFDTLEDIKLLIQCSTVSKRFNSLTCLVPTLTISYPSIYGLHQCCPKILNKFKHIRSLRVRYQTSTRGVNPELAHLYRTFSTATYEPHKHCIAVISYSASHIYSGRQKHHPTRFLTDTSMYERHLYASTAIYTSALFHLHHVLFSSIRDHKLLQKVMVNDFNERESFIMGEERLVKLRSISTDNVQVEGCERTGFADILSLPFTDNKTVVLKNVCFSVLEKWTSSTDRINKDRVIPQFDIHTRQLGDALEYLLDMEDVSVDDHVIPRMVSKNNWH